MKSTKESVRSAIVYSCYFKQSRDGEHFVPTHTLTYQMAGSLVLSNGVKPFASQEGSFRLVRRNQLLKFTKYPPENGEYQSFSFYFDQPFLRDFSNEFNVTASETFRGDPVITLSLNAILKSYLDSLMVYHQTDNLKNPQLVNLKLKEGLLLLMQSQPELKNILFDFVEPHKIDLEAFMNKNYHFNVRLDRFAYLTGRSLATFKRDFEKIFQTSPHRWLLQRRLHEAHFLLEQKQRKASEIYLDLGFEDLSHFSYAFKKQYGEAPSKLMR